MWNKVSQLLGLSDSDGAVDRGLELATAALLVQVSVADDDFDAREKQVLLTELRQHFGLSDVEAEHLMTEAVDQQADASCLYRFTRIVTSELNQDGRQEIVRLLWRVALADHRLENFELNAIAKISGLLGVTAEDRIRIKHEVERDT